MDLYISMHIVKEATQSSKIEGTQTNMKLTKKMYLWKTEMTQKVANYISAMKSAIKDLESLPISSRLIKKTHKTLTFPE